MNKDLTELLQFLQAAKVKKKKTTLESGGYFKHYATADVRGVVGFETPGIGSGVQNHKYDKEYVYTEDGIRLVPHVFLEKFTEPAWLYELCYTLFSSIILDDTYNTHCGFLNRSFDVDARVLIYIMYIINKRTNFAVLDYDLNVKSFNEMREKHETAGEWLIEANPEFADVMKRAIKSVLDEKYDGLARETLGEFLETGYTYNGHYALTQDISYTYDVVSEAMAVVFHTGVDARCGFSGPVFCYISLDMFGEILNPEREYVVTFKSCKTLFYDRFLEIFKRHDCTLDYDDDGIYVQHCTGDYWHAALTNSQAQIIDVLEELWPNYMRHVTESGEIWLDDDYFGMCMGVTETGILLSSIVGVLRAMLYSGDLLITRNVWQLFRDWDPEVDTGFKYEDSVVKQKVLAIKEAMPFVSFNEFDDLARVLR